MFLNPMITFILLLHQQPTSSFADCFGLSRGVYDYMSGFFSKVGSLDMYTLITMKILVLK